MEIMMIIIMKKKKKKKNKQLKLLQDENKIEKMN